MRWPWASRELEAAALRDTEDLVRRYAANVPRLGERQQERLRAATLAALASQRVVDSEQRHARRMPRSLALAAALAALLVLAGTVAAAESGPGRPLYGLRLTVESMTLPREGAARTEALLGQLDRRLDEAGRESERGNDPGVADAVRAYLTTLDEISATVESDGSQVRVEARLVRHVRVLQEVLDSAPAPAQSGLRQALDGLARAQRAIELRLGGPSLPVQPGPPDSVPGPPESVPGPP